MLKLHHSWIIGFISIPFQLLCLNVEMKWRVSSPIWSTQLSRSRHSSGKGREKLHSFLLHFFMFVYRHTYSQYRFWCNLKRRFARTHNRLRNSIIYYRSLNLSSLQIVDIFLPDSVSHLSIWSFATVVKKNIIPFSFFIAC